MDRHVPLSGHVAHASACSGALQCAVRRAEARRSTPKRAPQSFAILAGALLLAGCSAKAPEEASADTKPAAISVRTLTAAPSNWPSIYEAVGTVRARTAAVISARVMGYVRQVNVRAGDRVRQGQLLVAIDARDLEAGLLQAEAARNEARSALPEAENGIAGAKANLELAQVTYNRMKDLFDKRSVSNQEFDEAAAKLKVAKATYEMALAKKSQLQSKIAQTEQGYASAQVTRSYSQITAPFDGVVTERAVEPGSMATPGTPLLTVEREGGYRLEAAIEESKLASIRRGQAVAVSLEALGRTLQGRVSEVVPAVDAASRAFTVKIDLPPDRDLRSGIFGRARFELGSREALAIPADAVQQRGQLASVFVIDSGSARARLVTTGSRNADRVEILSGLNPGDKLIYPVPEGLADGARVEAR